MNKIRHIFRLHNLGRSKVAIAQQVGIARNTVKRYLKAFLASELTYEHIRDLADKELEELFGAFPEQTLDERTQTLLERLPLIDKELKRAGTTRLSLWEAYQNDHPDGFGYTQFCHHYKLWKARVNPVMHLDHKAGDKLFIDFAGIKLSLLDTTTGELRAVEVFIAILGASQLTYVQAVMSQQKEDRTGGPVYRSL